MRRPLRFLLLALLAGCADDGLRVATESPPELILATIAANPNNAISALITVQGRDADSVAVRYRLADGTASIDSITPAVPLESDSAIVPVLGLLPAQHYVMRAVLFGAGGSTSSTPLTFTTSALPADLPRFSAGGTNPAPGFLIFSTGQYGIAIDNSGRVVWYHHFDGGPGLNFMAQPNGRFAAKPPTLTIGDVEPWLELDASGNVVRTITCQRGLQSRFHDLISGPNGDVWIMCDDTRTMDLRAFGGLAQARVTGTTVQHLGPSGELLFEWSPFDHFAVSDLEPFELSGASVNWTHGNAIDLDRAGNLIISFRNLGEVTKIDARTGAVIWRLGGRRNDFRFVDTPVPAFARQHAARIIGDGSLLLLDNVGDISASRAERYVLDESARTARLANSYGSLPNVVTQIGGSVQAIDGGRTLVSFGTEGRIEEYDASGQVTWRVNGNIGYVFRAQRILSLYSPGIGTSR